MLTRTNCQLVFSSTDPGGAPPTIFDDDIAALAIKSWVSYKSSYEWTPDFFANWGHIYRFLFSNLLRYPNNFPYNGLLYAPLFFQVKSDPGNAAGHRPYYKIMGLTPSYLSDGTINYWYATAIYQNHQALWV